MYKTVKYIEDSKGKQFRVGDKVSLHFPDGGGTGCVIITKITDTGFRYTAGGREKTIQYSKVADIQKY